MNEPTMCERCEVAMALDLDLHEWFCPICGDAYDIAELGEFVFSDDDQEALAPEGDSDATKTATDGGEEE